MNWSWSHTQKAYQAAYDNLKDVENETLAIILAEWTTDWESDTPLQDYDRELAKAKQQVANNSEAVVDSIWEKASELATCDTGGFEAWVCPEGCHTVPFSKRS